MASPALTLIVEDELKKIVYGDRLFKHKEKLQGLIPRGLDSPFGDFPITGHSTKEDHTNIVIQPKKVSCNGRGIPPPSSKIFERAPIKPTGFRTFYSRGDLPIQIQHGTSNKIGWKCDIETLDYARYFPIFLDGIREKEDPYRFLAVQGVYDMIENGDEGRLLLVIPESIIPLKHALNTRDNEVIATACKIIQRIVLVDGGSQNIGHAFVPYYRNLLPMMNVFKLSNHNVGSKFDYSQRKRLCLGDLIHETLQILETYGGDNAFINIKYMIPTYESVPGAFSN